MCAYLCGFIPGNMLCLYPESQHVLGCTILWLIMLPICQSASLPDVTTANSQTRGEFYKISGQRLLQKSQKEKNLY